MTIYCQDYYPLIIENNTWNVLVVIFQPPFDTSYSTITYKVSGDTVINSKAYKKLYSSTEEIPTNWNLWCFMREDPEKRVWLRMNSQEDESLMYDFSIENGDSVLIGYGEPIYLYVDSISEITVNQTQRQKFWLSCKIMPEYSETWIEGIGSSKGICWSGSAFLVGGWYWLLCMSEDGELIYINPNYESCYLITEIPDVDKPLIQIYPNPARNIVVIENKKNINILSISITTITGQIINQFDPEKTQLNISEIASGTYFLRISHKKGEVVKKIIIEH